MDASSRCRRSRWRTGLAISVSPSVEPVVSVRSTLATTVAGVSFAPIRADSITGAGEPFLVAPQLFKRLGSEELRGVSCWMTEWLQQVGCDQNWNLVQLEAEKPSRLGRIEASGNSLPTEKFGSL
jgi:hypothetical protein